MALRMLALVVFVVRVTVNERSTFTELTGKVAR